jgi:hypothetical protein
MENVKTYRSWHEIQDQDTQNAPANEGQQSCNIWHQMQEPYLEPHGVLKNKHLKDTLSYKNTRVTLSVVLQSCKTPTRTLITTQHFSTEDLQRQLEEST